MRSTTRLQMQIHKMDFKNKTRKTGAREQHHDDVRFVSRASVSMFPGFSRTSRRDFHGHQFCRFEIPDARRSNLANFSSLGNGVQITDTDSRVKLLSVTSLISEQFLYRVSKKCCQRKRFTKSKIYTLSKSLNLVRF